MSGQELRIYDVESGQHQVVATGRYISTPFWSPDGNELVFEREDAESEAILRLRLDAAGVLGMVWDGLAEDHTLVWQLDRNRFFLSAAGGGLDMLDVSGGEPVIERLVSAPVYFASVSPDGRWFTWQNESGGLYVEPWPGRERRWTIGTRGLEHYWLSDGTLVLPVPDGDLFTAAPTPDAESPFAPPELRFDDPRRGESPGWSLAVTADDRILHLVSPDQPSIDYVRVIPGWVDAMKRAVDEANR